MRKHARSDYNQAEIIHAFYTLGFSVLDTHQLGRGAPDLFVAKYGHTIAVEIKNGKKPPSQRKLTVDEMRWHREWQGDCRIVMTIADVEQLHKHCQEQSQCK